MIRVAHFSDLHYGGKTLAEADRCFGAGIDRAIELGVDYLLPVNPVTRYRPLVDELMVPLADIPVQDIGPWQAVLESLTTDRVLYDRVAQQSRDAALRYAEHLHTLPFETYLQKIVEAPKRSAKAAAVPRLSADKLRLLALRMRAQHAPAD